MKKHRFYTVFLFHAAGPGLEPRYHPPEGCVLPLDDPAITKYPDIFLPQ